MFPHIVRTLVVLCLALGSFLVPFTPIQSAEAGGGSTTPYVEWYNPSTITYGGWPVSTSAYIHNPTANVVKVQASAWFNNEALANYAFIVNASWDYIQQPVMGEPNCDARGCKVDFNGLVMPNSRIFAVFGVSSGINLGNFTIGSITVKIDGSQAQPLYAEGRANLVEGTKFDVVLERNTDFPVQGGHTTLMAKAVDRTLNDFELLGIGASSDCQNTVVPDTSRWGGYFNTTRATWYLSVYIPDSVTSCTITVLVKTKQTVVSANYTIKRPAQQPAA